MLLQQLHQLIANTCIIHTCSTHQATAGMANVRIFAIVLIVSRSRMLAETSVTARPLWRELVHDSFFQATCFEMEPKSPFGFTVEDDREKGPQRRVGFSFA